MECGRDPFFDPAMEMAALPTSAPGARALSWRVGTNIIAINKVAEQWQIWTLLMPAIQAVRDGSLRLALARQCNTTAIATRSGDLPMPGPRYCLLCGDELRGGRVSPLYCGVNCRTRAARMRKRGLPVAQTASPTLISLGSLLTEGMSCPCCGARIALHTTAVQAGMPAGHIASASAGQTAGRDRFANRHRAHRDCARSTG